MIICSISKLTMAAGSSPSANLGTFISIGTESGVAGSASRA